jgi:hypothetical protein
VEKRLALERRRCAAFLLRLTESLHKQVRELAAREGISINQFVATAVAEKMSALMTEEYLEGRAKRGSREGFERAMAKVKDRVPDTHDQIL